MASKFNIVITPKSHKIEYVSMHTIREITRLATMLAGLIAPRLRLGFVSATSRPRLDTLTTPHLRLDYDLSSIPCEHCRSSRNNPHCAPRHVIYYCVCVSTETSPLLSAKPPSIFLLFFTRWKEIQESIIRSRHFWRSNLLVEWVIFHIVVFRFTYSLFRFTTFL